MDKGKCYYVASASTGFVGLYDGGTEDIIILTGAVVCQRMRMQPQPGQIITFNSFEPVNVMEKCGGVVYIKCDYWFEIEDDSELHKAYKEVLKNWRIERSGLVTATPEQAQNLVNLHDKRS